MHAYFLPFKFLLCYYNHCTSTSDLICPRILTLILGILFMPLLLLFVGIYSGVRYSLTVTSRLIKSLSRRFCSERYSHRPYRSYKQQNYCCCFMIFMPVILCVVIPVGLAGGLIFGVVQASVFPIHIGYLVRHFSLIVTKKRPYFKTSII